MSTQLLSELQAVVDDLLTEHKIPALSVAILDGNRVYKAASGKLNIATGVVATPDSIFQIGSITKLFTASLVMQLVDEHKIELDMSVQHYLRDFQVADQSASRDITVRQLLNHTSGLMGDFFPRETFADGNPIARFVDRCNLLPQVHPPGEYYSYSNSAFSIAGRLVEVVTGSSWFESIEERIFKPLDMSTSVARPTEIPRFRVAMGHVLDSEDDSKWQLADHCYLSMGQAPAGASLTMSASDLVKFAKVHLNKGKCDSGEDWLSPNTIKLMQKSQIKLPPISAISEKYAAIGWAKSIFQPNGLLTLGHNGATFGNESMLRIIPKFGAAFAIVMNGSKPGVMDAISSQLMLNLTGVYCKEPEPKTIPTSVESLKALTGRFESFNSILTLMIENGNLIADVEYKIDPVPPMRLRLVALKDHIFASYNKQGHRLANLAFIGSAAGVKPIYLFAGGRLNRRV